MIRILGLLLIIAGAVALISGGIRWTSTETVFEAGPLAVTAEEQERIPIPPIAGGLAMAVGAVLLVSFRRRHGTF